MRLKVVIGAVVAGVATVLVPGLLPSGNADLSGALQLDRSFWAALPVLFAAGVLTSLTPCVYPLIPITVSIFGAGRAGQDHKGRAALLSATYVLGIATMYSALGVAAAASGKAFGGIMSNPWLMWTFAVLGVAFALSMFGVWEIRLPAALTTKLQGVKGVGFGPSFGMGLVAGIVAAPCTGPVLGAVLAFVAESQQLAVGFWLMFAYALGLGLLFFVIGTFAVRLPKGGTWMESVKTILGVALLLVAFNFVRPFVLPKAPEVAYSPLFVAIVGGLLVGAAVLWGAVHKSFDGHRTERLTKAAAIAVMFLGVACRFEWIVTPDRIGVSEGAAAGADGTAPAGRVAWLYSEAEALAKAKAENKPILVDFYADWCTACVELDKHTFTDPRVREVLAKGYVALKIDGTEETDEILALQQKYGVVGLPLVTVVTPDGRQLPSPRIAGFLGPGPFLEELAKVRLD